MLLLKEFNFRSRELCFRRFALLCLLLCLFGYYYIDYIMDFVAYRKAYVHKNAYFVNTSGCQVLAMDVFNPAIMEYLYHFDEVRCDNKTLLRTQDGLPGEESKLVLNVDLIEIMEYYNMTPAMKLECVYCELKRLSDTSNGCGNWTSFSLDYQRAAVNVPRHVNMVRVTCWLDSISKPIKVIYKDVLFFGPLPAEREQAQRTPPSPPEERLSVMIVGIDSVSHLNFLRQMPRSAYFVRKKLNHIEYWGYNKVGDNSYPNLIPLLSGLSPDELEEKCQPIRNYYDKCPLIWNDFKKAGYSTSFGEDSQVCGTFHYGKSGFRNNPTDYYSRPIFVDIRKDGGYESNHENVHCIGGKTFSQVLWEYFYKLLPLLRVRPFFSYFWWIEGVHDHFRFPSKLDMRFFYMLQTMERENILNRTLVLLMADHGARWGGFRRTYQGMIEDSQPLLIILYPSWLGDIYPLAVKNLQRNARSLVTNFDMYETLKDIIDLKNLSQTKIENRSNKLLFHLKNESLPRGISLFLPIPDERTCTHANIPAHYCLCHNLIALSTNDKRVLRSARFVLRQINNLLEPFPKCHPLTLNRVVNSFIATREEQTESHEVYEIRVNLETVPGLAQFEATVRFENYFMGLAGGITRSNEYGNQSYCVSDYRVEMYCYCF